MRKIIKRTETDSAYFLKITVYIMLGMLWIRFAEPLHVAGFNLAAFPLGLFLALLFIRHDHFAIDRKIEYPIVIILTIVSFFFNAGIVI